MKSVYTNREQFSIVIKIVFVLLFVGYLSIVKINQQYSWGQVKTETSAMKRGQTIEAITSPIEISRYLLYAIIQKDLDMALRGCAIDERIGNTNVTSVSPELQDYSVDSVLLPSSTYTEFVPINSSLFTTEYYTQICKIIDELDGKEWEIVDINYVKADEQLQTSYWENTKGTLDIWGMSRLCETYAVLEDENKNKYETAFTLAQYGETWKLYCIGSQLADISSEEPLRKVSEVQQPTDESSIKKLEEQIIIGKKTENVDEEELLPLNYFIASQKSEKTQRETIEEFTFCLLRKDFLGTLNYFNITNQDTYIEEQGEAAEQIKRFICSIFNINQDNISVESFGLENLPYLSLIGYYPLNNNEAIMVYGYEGNYYALGCTFVCNNTEWQIKELKIQGQTSAPGESIHISDKEFKEFLKLVENSASKDKLLKILFG